MNFKNLVENIVYIIIIAGLLILNTFFVLKQQEKAIIKAIEKSTTEINTKVKNDTKIKTKNKKAYQEIDTTSNVVIRPRHTLFRRK